MRTKSRGWLTSDLYFRDLRRANAPWRLLVEGADARYSVIAFKDRFYVRTNEGAPRYRLVRIDPAYLRTDRIAWTATHRHHAYSGDEPYANAYLFSYAFALPRGATTLTLPIDPRLRIFAISLERRDVAGGSTHPA